MKFPVELELELFCLSWPTAISVSKWDTLSCILFTVRLSSSIFESRLISYTRLRSYFSLTPSVRFNAAIISSPPFDVAGEYDCFHHFSPAEVSTELLDELLLLVFLFGVINRLDNSMHTSIATQKLKRWTELSNTRLYIPQKSAPIPSWKKKQAKFPKAKEKPAAKQVRLADFVKCTMETIPN